MATTLTPEIVAMPTAADRVTQTLSDSIDALERARTTIRTVTERIAYPHRGITLRFATLLRDCVTLHRHDANEQELRQLPIAMHALIDDLFHPVTPDLRLLVARQESENDRREQGIQDLRLIQGDSPFLMEEHAKALELDAASALSYARVLREEARRLRQSGEIGRARLGLQPQVQAS